MVTRIAVLGGGNGSLAAVADLALKGFAVAWWRREPSTFPANECVSYSGILGEGEVKPHLMTGELREAVHSADLVLAPVPAQVQPSLLDRLAPLLAPGQVVAFTPGTFGTWLGRQRRSDVAFLETGTLPYLARATAPNEVGIAVTATRLPTGSLPGSGPLADAAHDVFPAAYPSAVRVRDGLDAALTNWGPVLHPPLVVQNLGAIESLADRFDIHSEGTSEGLVRTILAVDEERTAVRRRLGVPGEHWPIRTHYEGSPEGMYGSAAKQRLVESGMWRESVHPRHRYVTEDILCGLTLNVSLGRAAGVPMPVSEALLALARVGLGVDPWSEGRTLEAVGVPSLPDLLASEELGVDIGNSGTENYPNS